MFSDMQSLAQIKALLAAHGLSPRHALGQNFLVEPAHLTRLVDAASLTPGETVLEIGPGTGTLTEELLARGVRVVAAEIDRGLAALLRATFANEPRFTLVEGDCLEGKHALAPGLLAGLGHGPFALVANLPYAAGTPVMIALLADHPRCRGLFVTVQREVAHRLVASPGTRDFGPLAVLAQSVASPQIIATLPPGCFWPRPDVTSAMVAIPRLANPATPEPRRLVDFCQRLFAQRRKQLGAVLGRAGPWPAGVTPDARAESLTPVLLEELARLHAPKTTDGR
jgi:16S rRNA (adenine1518-N6/adenine1519-N6)-dimethyltransferase